MTRHAQITQNNKFAISFQYLKKEVSDEVVLVPKTASLQCLYNIPKKELERKLIFCRQINIKVTNNFGHQSFLQGDTFIINGYDKHCQRTQGSKFAISLQYLKKKLGMEFIFWIQISIKVSTSWRW